MSEQENMSTAQGRDPEEFSVKMRILVFFQYSEIM